MAQKLQKLVSLNFAACDHAGVLLLIHQVCTPCVFVRYTKHLKLMMVVALPVTMDYICQDSSLGSAWFTGVRGILQNQC